VRGNPDGEFTVILSTGSIGLGHCYVTWGGDVRKIIEVKGERVTFVVRGKLAFPSWDRKLWRSTSKKLFAEQVRGEVPCDSRAGAERERG
jgi:hypothetical protein